MANSYDEMSPREQAYHRQLWKSILEPLMRALHFWVRWNFQRNELPPGSEPKTIENRGHMRFNRVFTDSKNVGDDAVCCPFENEFSHLLLPIRKRGVEISQYRRRFECCFFDF